MAYLSCNQSELIVLQTNDSVVISDDNQRIPLFEISYMYVGTVGFLVTIITGLIASSLTKRCKQIEEKETTQMTEISAFWIKYDW